MAWAESGTCPSNRWRDEPSRENDHQPIRSIFRESRMPFCPDGTLDNSPRFQPWVRRHRTVSPEGTNENPNEVAERISFVAVIQPSLRDSRLYMHFPTVETGGLFSVVPPGQRRFPCVFAPLAPYALLFDSWNRPGAYECDSARPRLPGDAESCPSRCTALAGDLFRSSGQCRRFIDQGPPHYHQRLFAGDQVS